MFNKCKIEVLSNSVLRECSIGVDLIGICVSTICAKVPVVRLHKLVSGPRARILLRDEVAHKLRVDAARVGLVGLLLGRLLLGRLLVVRHLFVVFCL